MRVNLISGRQKKAGSAAVKCYFEYDFSIFGVEISAHTLLTNMTVCLAHNPVSPCIYLVHAPKVKFNSYVFVSYLMG